MSDQFEAAKALQQKGADDTQPPKPVDPLVQIKKLHRRFGHIGAGVRLAWLIDEVDTLRAILRRVSRRYTATYPNNHLTQTVECVGCGARAKATGPDTDPPCTSDCELAAHIV